MKKKIGKPERKIARHRRKELDTVRRKDGLKTCLVIPYIESERTR